ncbi:MAG: leucyl/phenylalanyl-tRNA--protein transferase [Bacteriovoracales bacterium]|nr:leucyl/phenylalanyl-tRNA--protein transferase [Bacteriovoracales bacterium]
MALGGTLDIPNLLKAYRLGIFPWPIDVNGQHFLAWFSPNPRGVLYTDRFHIPKSLKKIIRKKVFQVTFNRDFPQVIRQCALAKRKNNDGTWITDEMIEAYTELHRQGHAYSVESSVDGELVGGMYGVQIGQFFSGESMFFIKSDASKVALATLVERLRAHDIFFLDTQMVTPVSASLGASEISRERFIKQMGKLIDRPKIEIEI